MEDEYDFYEEFISLMEHHAIFLNNLHTETGLGLDLCADEFDLEREPLENDSQLRDRCLKEYKQIQEHCACN